MPLHPDRRVETFAAETAHWGLYAALFSLPLSGWVMHAAEDGFAPIWWPFGQSLPFVPKSESWAAAAGMVHWAAGATLGIPVAAHIAGALKHALVDHDSTLSRMWRGTDAGDPARAGGHVAAFVASTAIWVGELGLTLVSLGPPGGGSQAQTAGGGDWTPVETDLAFTVQQLGSASTGHFEAVTSDISYDPDSGTGAVTLDRRDFGIGASYDDESSVGFAVEVAVELTATR